MVASGAPVMDLLRKAFDMGVHASFDYDQPAALQIRTKETHPQTVNFGEYSEWENVDQQRFDEFVHYAENGYSHYEYRKLYVLKSGSK